MPAQHTRTQRQAQELYALAAKHTHTKPEGHGCPRMVSMDTVGNGIEGNTISGHGSVHVGTDDPDPAIFYTYGKGRDARAKTTPPNLGGEKEKKKQKERSERTPHQGIAYSMPNTTVAERKEWQKNETGRNRTTNKIHKTPQQNINTHICPEKNSVGQKKCKQKAENQIIVFVAPKH